MHATQCPYHRDILQLDKQNLLHGKGVMDRFISEGADEQPAVFIRPDNKSVSIHKGCTCAQKAEKHASKI